MSRFVAVLMGSDSDMSVMQEALNVLEAFHLTYEVRILSAHRTPDATRDFVTDAESRGCGVFIAGAGLAAHLAGAIAGAGLAAHLAGAIAAHTLRPVIGVPIDAGPLRGLDALLSTVQMPGGIPVATVAIGKAGARNAGHLAAQILALADDELAAELVLQRAQAAQAVLEKNNSLDSGKGD